MPAVALAWASVLRQTQWVKRAVTQETCDFRVIFLSSANSTREQTHITGPSEMWLCKTDPLHMQMDLFRYFCLPIDPCRCDKYQISLRVNAIT